MSFITQVTIYFSISLVFMITVFTLLIRRKRKHKRNFESLWPQLKTAIENGNVPKIQSNGGLLLWNDFMEREHYIILKKSVDALVLNNSNLCQLKFDIDKLFDKKGWLA